MSSMIIAYIVVACVVGFSLLVFAKYVDDDEIIPTIVFGTALWPISLVILVFIGVVLGINAGAEKTAEKIEAWVKGEESPDTLLRPSSGP